MDKTMNQPSKPKTNIYVHDSPDWLKDKEVGHVCRIEVIAKVKSKSEHEEGASADLEIQSMKYIGKAGKKSKEEYVSMKDDEREEYDREQIEDEPDEEDEDDG